MEKTDIDSLLAQEKADLPEGFNVKVLEGMEPADQVMFLQRFKAAYPKKAKPVDILAEKPITTRQVGAQVPNRYIMVEESDDSAQDMEPRPKAKKSSIPHYQPPKKHKKGNRENVPEVK